MSSKFLEALPPLNGSNKRKAPAFASSSDTEESNVPSRKTHRYLPTPDNSPWARKVQGRGRKVPADALLPEHKDSYQSRSPRFPGSTPLLAKKDNHKREKRQKVDRSSERHRFANAMRKAVKARTSKLARRLSKEEFRQLRDAVKKQCVRVFTNSFSARLSTLETTVSRLNSAFRGDPGVIATEKVALLMLQLDIVRTQLFELTNESHRVQEGCTHLASKLKIQLDDPVQVEIRAYGFPRSFVTIPAGTQVLCCGRCLQSRADFLFESFGLDVSPLRCGDAKDSHDFLTFGLYSESSVPSPLQGVAALCLQPIWTAVLDAKFERKV